MRAYAEKKRDQWVLEWPGQVVIAVDNIYWTKEVAEAIEKGKLDAYYQVLRDGQRAISISGVCQPAA